MKAQYVGVRDLKTHLSALLHKSKPLIVTERGKPSHFVLPYEEMLEIVEVLEEASDPRLAAETERARAAYKKGKEVPLKIGALQKRLHLE